MIDLSMQVNNTQDDGKSPRQRYVFAPSLQDAVVQAGTTRVVGELRAVRIPCCTYRAVLVGVPCWDNFALVLISIDDESAMTVFNAASRMKVMAFGSYFTFHNVNITPSQHGACFGLAC